MVKYRITREAAIHWILRLGVAGEFVGHGWVGIGRPLAWLPFFQVFGFSTDFAQAAMPLIGCWDILVGLSVLLMPLRVVLVWTAGWGLFTALLRPLAGQGWWEFVERAGNYGVPITFVLLAGVSSSGSWRISGRCHPTPALVQRTQWILRLTIAAVLIGHGGIGAFSHPAAWTGYLAVLGLPAELAGLPLVPTVGWLEILMGLVVVMKPLPGVLLCAFAWKVLTEALRPLAGEEFGQFVERGGSYAAPLALALFGARSLRRARNGPDSFPAVGVRQPDTGRAPLRSRSPTPPARNARAGSHRAAG
jgi:hypothetical protein